jgi:hypothetical protein
VRYRAQAHLGLGLPSPAGEVVPHSGADDLTFLVFDERGNVGVIGGDGSVLNGGGDEGHVHSRVVVLA